MLLHFAVVIPAAVKELDETHAPLGQTASQQTVCGVGSRLSRVLTIQLIGAFGLIGNVSQFKVLVNKTDNAAQGKAVYTKIARVADRFLDVTLTPVGEIPAWTAWRRDALDRPSVRWIGLL